MRATIKPTDTRSGEISETNPGLGSTQLQELLLKLRAQQGFIDALRKVMYAAEHPPPDSEVINILEHSLASVVEVTESEEGAVMLQDDNAGELVFVVTEGVICDEQKQAWNNIPEGVSIARWVAKHQRAAIVNDVLNDERAHSVGNSNKSNSIRSILAVPLVAEDHLLGVVEVLNKQNGALFTIGDQARLELMCHFNGELLAKIAQRAEQRQLESLN